VFIGLEIMGEKGDRGYKKLQISNVNWCTQFFLVNPEENLPGDSNELYKELSTHRYPEVDFSKCYDIKTEDGQVFEGSRVYCHTSRHEGSGGMDESSSSSIGFFQAGTLEAILNSGFLMRVNEEATRRMQAQKDRKDRKEKLQGLYEQRKELNEEIKKLESR
jgi:hypothetical protein